LDFTKNKIILLFLSIILFYVIFILYSDIEIFLDVYSEINFIYLFLIFSLLPLTLFIRSRNQSILLNSIGMPLSIKENYHLFLTGLSMSVTPIGFGQIIKSHFLESKYGYSISKSLPLVFVERLLDFIAIVSLLWVSLIFYFSNDTLIVLTISTCILFSLLLLIKSKKFMVKIQSMIENNSFLSKKFPNFEEFNNSLMKLMTLKILIKTILLISFVTSIEGIMIYVGFLSFDIDLGYFESFQLFYTSILVGIFSFLPGGIGITEGSFVFMLVKQNFEFVVASSLIIFLRLITIWSVTIIGFIATPLFAKK